VLASTARSACSGVSNNVTTVTSDVTLLSRRGRNRNLRRRERDFFPFIVAA
jgi:hypothetical protein